MKLLERTAFHEAGHAVASCVLRVPFDKVTIEREGTILGSVFSKKSLLDYLGDEFLYDPRAVTRAMKVVTVLQTGQIAERIASGRTNRVGAASDSDDTVELALHLHGSGEAATAFLKENVMATERRIRERWTAVHALADLLLEKTTVGGREARQLIRTH
jgi:Peptidase family M41.